MKVLEVLRVLLIVVVLLVSVVQSEVVQCFANFDLTLQQCHEEVGDVDEDDCCQNPHYGYKEADGECHSCGLPEWSPWSPWSPCNVLCGEGVTQRKRKCHGIGQPECENMSDKLQTQACDGVCCHAEGWGLWLSWSACSVTCGEGGVRERKRVCASPPECNSLCSGPSEEKEACPTQTCPVHGGWSLWSGWSPCSGTCIDDQRTQIIPHRTRQRSCSSPAPSADTTPPGNGCPGDGVQSQYCSELPNCPVAGSWGTWSKPGPCSVSCGMGLKLSMRLCNDPAPKYGGAGCVGQSSQTSVCQTPCPEDGFWTGWSGWGECSASCIPLQQTPTRTRHRSCSNPAPSSDPAGKPCQGGSGHTENCDHLPHCPVNGGWGSWSPFSSCPVSCGVGIQVSTRKCDSPASKHGGQNCPGLGQQTKICNTKEHCPVHGVWSGWSDWTRCISPHASRNIHCSTLGGSQMQNRFCLHQAHNGSLCSGDNLSQSRVCYDVDGCYVSGTWEGWEPWSLCRQPCGANSKRFRRRICKPDFSKYRPTIGLLKDKATFFGNPLSDCVLLQNETKLEVRPCHNVPACS